MKPILRNCALFCVALALSAGWAACGDDSGGGGPRPDGQQTSIEGGAAIYNVDGLLEVPVTVTVRDTDANPLGGVRVELDILDTGLGTVVEADGLTSDASGTAVFHVTSDTFGQTEVAVLFPNYSDSTSPTSSVEFTLSGSLSTGAPLPAPPGATVDATVMLEDGAGPLAAVDISLLSDRSSDTVDPTSQPTDAAGQALFVLYAEETGTATMSVAVGDLNGTQVLDTVDFYGPSISGQLTFDQSFGVLEAPRIGLLWVDFENWESGLGDPQELISTAVAVSADNPTGYTLHLPLGCPPEHLYHPDEPGLPADFELAPYMVVVYDDVGVTLGSMDSGDRLVGMNLTLPHVAYFSGTLPEIPGDANVGFNMMTFQQEGDPIWHPWTDWADVMDVAVTMAAVPALTLSGEVTFGDQFTAGDEWTLAAVLFDAVTFEGGNPFDPANHEVFVTTTVVYETNDATAYNLAIADLAGHAHYDDWAGQFGPLATVNSLMLFAYQDVNENGRPDFGNEPMAIPDQPWGVGGTFLWYFHPALDWLIHFFLPGIHEGYVLVRAPLEREITAINTTVGRLTLDEDIEPDHTAVSFKITRNVGGEDIIVVEGDDLDTGVMIPGNEVTTNVDLSGVQIGDTLVITEVIDDMEILDPAQPLDFVIP
jgi:hypothetical protein